MSEVSLVASASIRGDKGDNRVRKPRESWHTAITNEADSNSMPLLIKYSILLEWFYSTREIGSETLRAIMH